MAKTTKTTKTVKTDKINNVLFVTTEAAPFASTGGMGEVCAALPRALNKTKKAEVRVLLPLYQEIAQRYKSTMTFMCNISVRLSWRNQYCGLFKLEHDGVVYYFVDNEYYFKRPEFYGYYDDAERFAFLSKAALELVPYLDFKPDVVQSHDYLTALVPIYYSLEYSKREDYPKLRHVFMIHNIGYQGVYPAIIAGDVFGISEEDLHVVEFDGKINLLKGAVETCDVIATMSPEYVKEIKQPEFSCGLDELIKERGDKIVGILNGVDTDRYNPKTNESLFENFDASSLEKKAHNKVELQRMLSLPEDPEIPLLCVVARMVPHKGYDLLRKSINKVAPEGNILDTNIQLVVMGRGDSDIEGYFMHIQKMYDRRVRAVITYNADLATKVLAAADMCLLPSRTEPCGLTQMSACRFGTVPVVHATGGLKDSITDCENGEGNGFVFDEYDSDAMDRAITRAVSMYFYHKLDWAALQKRCMACDFSWATSAKKFNALYTKLA